MAVQPLSIDHTEPTMKTVRETIDPAAPASLPLGHIDAGHVDVTDGTEELAHGAVHPDERESITLKQADFQAFVAVLDAPAEPNAALQRAFKQHADNVRK
ncbi:MAG: DUF1778 domain-containing protein [Rhodocyclaceae bacterium]